MSTEVQLALIGVLGTIAGTIVGLYGARWLRHSGKVECRPRLWEIEWWYLRQGGLDTVPFTSVSTVSEARDTARAQCTFKAEFFNEKEVPAAVTDLALVFSKHGKAKIVHTLMAPNIQEYDEGGMSSEGELDAFTLQPREVFSVNLETGVHEQEEKVKLLECDRAELTYSVFGDGEARQKIEQLRHAPVDVDCT